MENLERISFTVALAAYFLSTLMYLAFAATGNRRTAKIGRFCVAAGFVLHFICIVSRGIAAGRLPLTNQYEFASAFAWGIALCFLIFTGIYQFDILGSFIAPVIFLVIGYASMQSKEIHALMPALQSGWLGFHVCMAIISYGAFGVAFGVSGAYLYRDHSEKCGRAQNGRIPELDVLDNIIYRAVALGFLFLTLCMITGAIWANRAWGSYWSWDPKETWSLITWIIYAIYLHLRLNKGMNGRKSAFFALIGFISVLFTYIGVNTLLSGLHSYK
ncbi:MAG: c-type cytochrome biogenesis protein CcsB [Eubacteriales bacterium]|nr:c-type cytochrome biogenesis protein CcsB [Eubacteriales bacterium]